MTLSAVEENIKYKLYTSFARGEWDESIWNVAGNPFSQIQGEWVHNKDCISNELPQGTSIKDLLWERHYELYTSLVIDYKLSGNVELFSTMSFDDDKAPLIFISNDLEKSPSGLPTPREFLEIVLYNQGINIWQLNYIDGKQNTTNVASAKFELKPKIRYKLEVSIIGKEISIKVEDKKLDFVYQDLREEFYIGITACEGINRFYDFGVEQK